MRFSKRSHPIFEMIKTGDLSGLGYECEQDIAEMSKKKRDISICWRSIAPYIQRNINAISLPFDLAIERSADKVLDRSLLENILEKPKHGVHLRDDHAECYFIQPNKTGGYTSIQFGFLDTITKGTLQLGWFIYMNIKKDNTGTVKCYISDGMKKVVGVSLSEMQMVKLINTLLMAAVSFIEYAEVETKHLPAGKVTKDINCKYFNDTPYNINILDSKWFTTLVKSDAFKVRGHFRLQPYGEGMSQKKLIWINDFEKSGYTAPARKLNNN